MAYDSLASFKTIGGSDIGILTGSNKYSTPNELLQRKRNKVDIQMNLAMSMGKMLEDLVAQTYAKNMGVDLVGDGEESVVWEDALRATIDRYMLEPPSIFRVVDIKTRWKYWNTILPKYYVDQVIYYSGIVEDSEHYGNYIVADPLIVTMYQAELYHAKIPYIREYYEEMRQMAKEFYAILNSEMASIPRTVQDKWKENSIKYQQQIGDIKCQLIRGLARA